MKHFETRNQHSSSLLPHAVGVSLPPRPHALSSSPPTHGHSHSPLKTTTRVAPPQPIAPRESHKTALQWKATLSQTRGRRMKQEDVGILVQAVSQEGAGVLITGVCDGHGGVEGALYAADSLSRESLKALRAHNGCWSDVAPSTLGHMMDKAFLTTDAKLLDYLTSRGITNAGSTATLVVLSSSPGVRSSDSESVPSSSSFPESSQDFGSTSGVARRRLVVANVGDSHCVLNRQGTAHVLTRAHRVHGVGEDVEDEIRRVVTLGGWITRGRVCGIIAVSRSLGDPRFKGRDPSGLARDLETLCSQWRGGTGVSEWAHSVADGLHCEVLTARPDVTVVDLDGSDEFLLVASDGLWDVVTPQEAVDFISERMAQGLTQQEATNALVRFAVDAGSRDNVLLIAVNLITNQTTKSDTVNAAAAAGSAAL